VSVPEGRVIPPIAAEDYVPKHDTDLSKYRRIFPKRVGSKPRTTDHQPQQQINQHGDPALWDELHKRCFALPDVSERESLISIPGARALWLDDSVPKGSDEAFIIEREFAHVHPQTDASMHLQLPLELVVVALGAGWVEPHVAVWNGLAPANTVLLYAPRTEDELEVIFGLVQESYRFARGEPASFAIKPQPVDSPAS
jgi:phospholipase/carboxylesterase